jgi:hypothetical protein
MPLVMSKHACYVSILALALAIAGCGGGGSSSQPVQVSQPSPSPTTVVASTATTWFVPDGTKLDATQTANLFDTGQLYFNVQRPSSSSDEIRGEILSSSSVYSMDNGDPFAANPSNAPVTFAAILRGDQVRPRNVITGASGYGAVTIDPVTRQAKGCIVTSGIVGSGAQIKDGLAGTDGTTVLTLEGGPVVWTVPANTLLTDAQIARLSTGAYYLNVSSSSFPGGELRGQLDQQVRSASLSGASEVPPVTGSASGVGYLALKKSTRQFSGLVKATGLSSSIVSVALHIGTAGTNGIAIVTLQNSGNGIWEVPINTVLGDAQVASFNNDELYFNVHTSGNIAGEIRGQLLKAAVKVGTASLDGSKAIPPVATQGNGSAKVALNTITGQLSGSLRTDKVSGTLAQIHSGLTTATGPAIVSLTTSSPVTVTPTASISFSQDIQPLFSTRCAGTFCHVVGGIAPMSLQPGLAYANTINLVIPGNSAGSYFVSRLTGAIMPQMPLAGAPLNATELSLIKAWIDNGALNN